MVLSAVVIVIGGCDGEVEEMRKAYNILIGKLAIFKTTLKCSRKFVVLFAVY